MSQPDEHPIDLSIGDPGYEPPPEVRAVAARAIVRGLGGYAPAGGVRRLRSALAERLTERDGLPATADQVVVTSGASLGIFATLSALCRAGEVVLVPDPCFPLYRLAARTLGLRVVAYPVAGLGRGEPDWDALAELAPDARLLMWNYPSNPVGTVAEPAWFGRLFTLLDQLPQLILLSDEVYQDLYLSGGPVGLVAASAGGELADRVVSAFSFSKSFGMAAWRVGYLHAQPEWAARIARAHWAATMSTSTVSQLAALAALRLPASYLAERRAFLRANRDVAVARLSACGLPCAAPAAGFFAWVDIGRYGIASETFARRCATEAGVLISPGSDFGPAGTSRVRINYAVPAERLATALDRLEVWARTRMGSSVGGG